MQEEEYPLQQDPSEAVPEPDEPEPVNRSKLVREGTIGDVLRILSEPIPLRRNEPTHRVIHRAQSFRSRLR
jgi:hypothetical protein